MARLSEVVLGFSATLPTAVLLGWGAGGGIERNIFPRKVERVLRGSVACHCYWLYLSESAGKTDSDKPGPSALRGPTLHALQE